MQDSSLKTSPSIIIVAVSAIILCIVGIVAIIDEIRVVNSTTSEPAALDEGSGIKSNMTSFVLEKLASAQKAEFARHCANCGVIDSITMNEVKGDSGAYAGHEIEKNLNKTVTHQVKVRMDNGTYRVVSQQDQPVVHVGEKVKIVNGMVVQLEKAKMIDKKGMFALILVAFSSQLF